MTRSGLLLPRQNDRAAFYHLSFQEFLAAQRIVRVANNLDSVFSARGPTAEWRSTLLFLFAATDLQQRRRVGTGAARPIDCEPDRATVKAKPGLAVFIAEALELCLAKNYRVPEALAEAFRRLSLEAIDDEIELHARQAIGLCLGRLGDPRIPGLRDPRLTSRSRRGPTPMATRKRLIKIAAPFRLGRYPVTNRQFRDFLDDKGYEDAAMVVGGRLGVAAKGRSDRACVLARPAVERSEPAGGGGKLLGGRSLQQMGRRRVPSGGGRLPERAGVGGCRTWSCTALAYPWGSTWQDGICNTR